MVFCENKICINCINDYNYTIILDVLKSDDLHFFQSFLPLEPNQTKLEAYGTDSDVYTEYIDFHNEDKLIYITLFTNETPCTEFCKRFCKRFCVDIQFIFYNEDLDFSGMFFFKNNEVLNYHHWNYHEGMYFTDPERFWELDFEYIDVDQFMFLSISQINQIKQNVMFEKFKKNGF